MEEDKYEGYEQNNSLLLEIEPYFLLSPPRVNVEAKQLDLDRKRGVWECNPKHISILKAHGADIPSRDVIFFSAKDIDWDPGSGIRYTQACPLADDGGMFRRVKLHGLLFGVGAWYVGCKKNFAIASKSGPVWITVNDNDYSDNSGNITIRLKWR